MRREGLIIFLLKFTDTESWQEVAYGGIDVTDKKFIYFILFELD